jgi:putative DNA methylase
VLRPDGIAAIVFASKTTASWEAILKAVVDAGWIITGSWPIDTEIEARVAAQGQARLASSVHLVCRPREDSDGSVRTDQIGDWRDVLQELPRRIHEWMPRLAEEGVVGADAIFACLGPALEIFSRYSRVEKASGETVSLNEYLEQVWAAVSKEALAMIFTGADATGFEEDARLTAMWLWTLSTAASNGNGVSTAEDEEPDEDQEYESANAKSKIGGFVLEYDAARKIAQGLGAHLEQLASLIEVKGATARLLPVAERTRSLFQKGEAAGLVGRVKAKKKSAQLSLGFVADLEEAETSGGWGDTGAPHKGETVLDRVHQSMILFGAGRGEALKRFLVDDGAGRDDRFWRLAQAFSALYPPSTDEKRWVDGVLARKKSLGF